MTVAKSLPQMILVLLTMTSIGATAKEAITNIKFSSPHIPIDVTKHGADQFRKTLEKLTSNKATIDFSSYGDGKAGAREVLTALKKGDFAISQVYVEELTEEFPQLTGLSVPYLFQSHEHVSAFINSPAGKSLLASLEMGGLKGLGFTYSGGERIIISDRKIEKYEDFRGLKFRITPYEQNVAMHKLLGTKVGKYEFPDGVKLSRRSPLDMMNSKQINAGDAIYTDFWKVLSEGTQKNKFHLNEMGTGYLMSVIVMDLNYYNKLPAKLQSAVTIAGVEAATAERNYAISQEQKTTEIALASGWTIHKMNLAERQRLKELLAPVIASMTAKAGTAVVNAIEATKNTGATLSKVD